MIGSDRPSGTAYGWNGPTPTRKTPRLRHVDRDGLKVRPKRTSSKPQMVNGSVDV